MLVYNFFSCSLSFGSDRSGGQRGTVNSKMQNCFLFSGFFSSSSSSSPDSLSLSPSQLLQLLLQRGHLFLVPVLFLCFSEEFNKRKERKRCELGPVLARSLACSPLLARSLSLALARLLDSSLLASSLSLTRSLSFLLSLSSKRKKLTSSSAWPNSEHTPCRSPPF